MSPNQSIRVVFTAIAFLACCIPGALQAQLSNGEGAMVHIPNTRFKCFLPKHFVVQENPPGVMHKVSGTFVIAVKVPADKNITLETGIPRDVFEDPRYTIISLEEKDITSHKIKKGRLYHMKYTIGDSEFERYTLLLRHGDEHFLVIGNYVVRLKDQVHAEVKKIVASFTIH